MIKDQKSHAVPALPFAERAIGADLKKARQAANLTTSELATKLVMPVSDLVKIEEGHAPIPKGHVSKVLIACGLPNDWKP